MPMRQVGASTYLAYNTTRERPEVLMGNPGLGMPWSKLSVLWSYGFLCPRTSLVIALVFPNGVQAIVRLAFLKLSMEQCRNVL